LKLNFRSIDCPDFCRQGGILGFQNKQKLAFL
jgi:hypothetical protein